MHQRGKAEMSGYECPIKFGTSIVPAAATPAEARALARETNGARVDMIGIQDTQGGRLPQQRWCATPTRKRHNGRAGIADRACSVAASTRLVYPFATGSDDFEAENVTAGLTVPRNRYSVNCLPDNSSLLVIAGSGHRKAS